MNSTTKEQSQVKTPYGSVSPSRYNYSLNIRNYLDLSKFLIIFVTLAFTLSGTYYAFFLTPKYTATVYLSSKIYGSLGAVAASLENSLPVDDKDTSAPRQLALLQTPNTLKKLVDTLHLDLEISSLTPQIDKNELSLKALALPPSVIDQDLLLSSKDALNYKVQISGHSKSFEGKVGVSESYSLQNGEKASILVESLPQGDSSFRIVKHPSGQIIDDLLTNIVWDAPGIDTKLVTNVLTVAYTGMEPKKVTDIVNTLAALAVEASKEQEKITAAATIKTLSVENANIIGALEKSGKELADLSARLDLVGLDDKSNAKYFSDQLVSLEKNVSQAKSDLSILGQSVTEQNQKYLEKLASLNSLIAVQDKYSTMTKNSLTDSSQLTNLQREINAYTTLYEDSIKNLEQLKARLMSPVGDLQILELAVEPDTPSSLSRPLIIFLSLIVGLIAGYVVALVFD